MDDYPTRLKIEEKNGRTLRLGMEELRIEYYKFDHELYAGYGYVIWKAEVVANGTAYLIAEGRDHDHILKKLYEFIEAA